MTAIFGSAAFVAGLIGGSPVAFVLAAVALVATVLNGRRAVVMGVVVACAVAGDLRGTGELARPQIEEQATGRHRGTIEGYARRAGETQRFTVSVDGVSVCATADRRLRMGRGDVIEFDGTLLPLQDLPSSRWAALRQLGCGGTVRADGIVVVMMGHGPRRWVEDRRRDVVEWFASVAPGDPGVLMAGLVVGDDYDLSNDAMGDMRTLGLSHITAVSGSNLALLTWLLVRSGTRRRTLAVDLALLGGLWFYVLLAGAGPSTVRAGLTATMCVVAMKAGRRPDLLTVACLVAAGQVAFDPALIDSVAYRLSTIAMLVMVTTLTGRRGESFLDKVAALVVCSVAIQLGVLAFTPRQDQAILAGIVANVVLAPVVAFAFAASLGAAIVQTVSPSLGEAVATLGATASSVVLGVAERLAGSRLAAVRPDIVGAAPLMLVRASLIAMVVLTFGRHARRGLMDVWARVRSLERPERMVWASATAGAAVALGVLGPVLAR